MQASRHITKCKEKMYAYTLLNIKVLPLHYNCTFRIHTHTVLLALVVVIILYLSYYTSRYQQRLKGMVNTQLLSLLFLILLYYYALYCKFIMMMCFLLECYVTFVMHLCNNKKRVKRDHLYILDSVRLNTYLCPPLQP